MQGTGALPKMGEKAQAKPQGEVKNCSRQVGALNRAKQITHKKEETYVHI